MEYQENNESVFEFSLNEIAQGYLRSSAKWEKFLAWVNIILLCLSILFCLFAGLLMPSVFSGQDYGSSRNNYLMNVSGGMMKIFFITYSILLVIILIPNFYRLTFANKCINAIDNQDEEMLTQSLRSLKTYSTYWGILTIIFISIYALLLLVTIISAAMH
jgi:uncharacterized membrane protein YjgN (DUF898 family)